MAIRKNLVKMGLIVFSLFSASQAFAVEFCFGAVEKSANYKIDAFNAGINPSDPFAVPLAYWVTNPKKAHCFLQTINSVNLYRADGSWPFLKRFKIIGTTKQGYRSHELKAGYYEIEADKTMAYYKSEKMFIFHTDSALHCDIHYSMHIQSAYSITTIFPIYSGKINGLKDVAFNYSGDVQPTNYVSFRLFHGGFGAGTAASLNGKDLPSTGLAPGKYRIGIFCGDRQNPPKVLLFSQ